MSDDDSAPAAEGYLGRLPQQAAEDFAQTLSRFLETARRIQAVSEVANLEAKLPIEAHDHRQSAERFQATAAHHRQLAALHLQAAAQQELLADLLLDLES